MAFNVSYIYQAIDRFTPISGKISRSIKNMEGRINATSLKLRTMGENITTTGAKMLAFASIPLYLLSKNMLSAAATMESMEVSFESMLGSASKAKKMMRDLVNFAAKTPFELVGIGAATKQLLAFGVKQEDIIENLQILGDIASGADAPLSDMAAIFGKMKAKGKAMTEEILQLSDRGVPIIEVLGKIYNKTGEQVLDLASKSKLSFKVVSDALRTMTEKGGIFYRQMIKQSRTLSGLFSTMSDVIFAANARIGDSIVTTTNLKDKMVELSNWIEKMTTKFEKLSPQTKQYIVYTGILVGAIAPLLMVLGLLVASFGLMAKALLVLVLPFKLFKYAILASIGALKALQGATLLAVAGFKLLRIAFLMNPFGFLVGVIGFVIAGIVHFRKELGGAINSLFKFFNMEPPEWAKKFFGIDGKVNISEGNITGQQSFKPSDINRTVESVLNGNITVSAEQGTKVQSVNVSTKGGIKANLGMSMAGAY